jgi:hypothetical protein
VAFSCNCQLDHVFSDVDGRQGPEKAKPGTPLIKMRGIERKPTAATSDNMAQMPLGINEAAD